MRGIAERSPGAWRRNSVRISGSEHVPPSGLKVPEEIDRFLRWMNEDAPAAPLVRAALAHGAFEHLHPFQDGNGRTGRLLANLILLRGGYPVVVLRKEDPARYDEALRAADGGDATELLTQFCEAMERRLGEYERIQADREAREPEVQLLADKPRAAEKEKAVALELTADEALVLFELLSRTRRKNGRCGTSKRCRNACRWSLSGRPTASLYVQRGSACGTSGRSAHQL